MKAKILPTAKILAFATQGRGGDDEARLKVLLEPWNTEFIEFQVGSLAAKYESFMRVLRRVRASTSDLLVMEGRGIAGGTDGLRF